MTTISDPERKKYERMWQAPLYRRTSPGERLVERAIKELALNPGERVIDFGCGTGRPAARLQALGYEVHALDIAENCLDMDLKGKITLTCCPLWAVPDHVEIADWGFCTDVMEHIPTNMVLDTLMSIRELTRGGCFFQIATRPDSCGKLIGEKLHLTVKDADWWKYQLENHWDVVNVEDARGGLIAVCR